jgi:ElaB/YqjD/DUF883 family membrane-anchored ribosome-binding protein
MSSMNPGVPSGVSSGTPYSHPSEHGGNGSLGAGAPPSPCGGAGSVSQGAGRGAGPTGPGTFPDPVKRWGGRSWTHSDTSQRSEFGAFLDDLSDLARGTGGGAPAELRGEIEHRVSQARERMSQALDQGVEMSHRARDQMQRGIDYSRDTVSGRPLSALMVAAVGGLIVGLLLSRRD